MSFTDRFFGGVRKYLQEAGFKFKESERIIDVYEEREEVHCIVRDAYTDDYRTVKVEATLAEVVANGRIGLRM